MADMHTPLKLFACDRGDYGDYDGECVVLLTADLDRRVAIVFQDDDASQIVAAVNAPSQDAETIKALREALTEAAGTLEGLSYIHDGNPSDARADMAPVEYARHMLFEARQMARAAHAEARAALAGSAS